MMYYTEETSQPYDTSQIPMLEDGIAPVKMVVKHRRSHKAGKENIYWAQLFMHAPGCDCGQCGADIGTVMLNLN